MTEIPEHLLKRSKERRAALGGEGAGEEGVAATPATVAASAAVAPAAAAAPARAAAPAAPPKPKPDPPYIAAYKQRKKIPFWAMATLSLLPIWGFMYVQGVKPEAKVVHGPLGDGAKLFVSASCAGCHGTTGGGGVGRKLADGEVLLTFPNIEDQLNLVYTGSQAYATAKLKAYGDPARGHLGYNGSYMPFQGTKAGGALTDAQILAVVCHERYDIGGADPASTKWKAEYDKWCSPDSAIYAGLKDGSLTFDNLATKTKGTLTVGTKPRPSGTKG